MLTRGLGETLSCSCHNAINSLKCPSLPLSSPPAPPLSSLPSPRYFPSPSLPLSSPALPSLALCSGEFTPEYQARVRADERKRMVDATQTSMKPPR